MIYSMDDDSFVEIKFSAAEALAKANYKLAFGSSAAPKEGGTVLLLRPFQTYNMASAVLMKGGLETGFTAHGHHDFMMTDDVIHKVHIGHYTFYHKSVVKHSKNIMIAEDVFSHSYVSGEGASLFPEGSLPDALTGESFDHDLIPVWVDPADSGPHKNH